MPRFAVLKTLWRTSWVGLACPLLTKRWYWSETFDGASIAAATTRTVTSSATHPPMATDRRRSGGSENRQKAAVKGREQESENRGGCDAEHEYQRHPMPLHGRCRRLGALRTQDRVVVGDRHGQDGGGDGRDKSGNQAARPADQQVRREPDDRGSHRPPRQRQVDRRSRGGRISPPGS